MTTCNECEKWKIEKWESYAVYVSVLADLQQAGMMYFVLGQQCSRLGDQTMLVDVRSWSKLSNI